MSATTIAISFLAFLIGQSSEDAGILEGYVFRADTAQAVPVSGAAVWLNSQKDSRTFTNAAGYFRFMGVTPGKHTISAGHSGYVIAEYGQRAPGLPGTGVTVHEGRKTDPLIFRLVPTGVVTGIVYDYDNEPIADTLVQLVRERYRSNGERFYVSVDTVRTDDRGIFRFYWITPGEYLVATTPRAPDGPAGGKPNLTPRLDRLPTFYPSVTNPAQAVPVAVGSGEVVEGLTITFTEPDRSRVRGTIIDSRTGKGVQAHVRLNLAEVGLLAERQSDAEGNYVFNDVPPGTYTVSAESIGDTRLRGSENFELGPRQLSDIDVRAETSLRLSGQIKAEDGQAGDLSRISLYLPGVAVVQPDGRFEAEVYRGNVSLAASFPENYADYYIKSARIGSADVLNSPYRVEGEMRDPLEIVISPASAQVHGVILDTQNSPYPSAQVVLVPAGQIRPRPQDYRTARTDQNGVFTLRGLPPGEYNLFAWDAIEEYAYYDPDFLRQYDRDSTRIILQRSETLDVRLPLITR